jgi:hypothetical protein
MEDVSGQQCDKFDLQRTGNPRERALDSATRRFYTPYHITSSDGEELDVESSPAGGGGVGG